MAAARLTGGWLGQAAESAPVRLRRELICRTIARGLRGELRTRVRSAPAIVPLFYRRDVKAHAVPVATYPVRKIIASREMAAKFRSRLLNNSALQATARRSKSLVNLSLLACTSGLNVPLLAANSDADACVENRLGGGRRNGFLHNDLDCGSPSSNWAAARFAPGPQRITLTHLPSPRRQSLPPMLLIENVKKSYREPDGSRCRSWMCRGCRWQRANRSSSAAAAAAARRRCSTRSAGLTTVDSGRITINGTEHHSAPRGRPAIDSGPGTSASCFRRSICWPDFRPWKTCCWA